MKSLKNVKKNPLDVVKMGVNKKSFKFRKIGAFLLAGIVIFVAVCGIYLETYYHADITAIEQFTIESTAAVHEAPNGNLIWKPENASAGLIFYPGGKVEHTAYIPLMEALSSRGILCVLVEMPFRLAVFDINAAEGIQDQYPEIEDWYIGGHSLGGAMAASYLAGCVDSYEGLLLLGSYSTEDFSSTDLSVLSIYGSEDTVLNREKYEECRKNLPTDYQELVIEGGCHAYFGMYGPQKGDGTPSITNEEQLQITADAVMEMIY